MASVCERVLMQIQRPYTFQSAHKRLLEPYDYYAFGQRYIRALVDFDRSRLGHAARFAQIQEQLGRGASGGLRRSGVSLLSLLGSRHAFDGPASTLPPRDTHPRRECGVPG